MVKQGNKDYIPPLVLAGPDPSTKQSDENKVFGLDLGSEWELRAALLPPDLLDGVGTFMHGNDNASETGDWHDDPMESTTGSMGGDNIIPWSNRATKTTFHHWSWPGALILRRSGATTRCSDRV